MVVQKRVVLSIESFVKCDEFFLFKKGTSISEVYIDEGGVV